MNKSMITAFGVLLGLALPPMSFALFFVFRPEILGMQRLEPSLFKVVNVRVLTLGLMLNAGAFFGALRFEWDAFARGILYGTVAWMAGIFI